MGFLSVFFVVSMVAILVAAGTDSVTSLACMFTGIIGTCVLIMARRAYNRRPLSASFGPPVHLLPHWNWRRGAFWSTMILAVGLFAWRCWAGVKYAGNHYPYLYQGLYLSMPLIYAAWWMHRLGWHLGTADRLHDEARYAYNGFQSMVVHAAFMGGHYEELARSALRAINYLEAASVVPGAHGVNNLERAEAAIAAADYVLRQIAAIDEEYSRLEKRRDDLQLYLTIQALGNYPEARAALREVEEALQRNEAVDLDCAAWLAERVRLQTWWANEIDRHHAFCRDVATTSV